MSLCHEGAFWAKLREKFKTAGAFLRKLPAEGFAGKGTPDGVFAIPGGGSGVIELKYVPRWPARAKTTVPIAVTPEQWNWLADYVNSGGRGFVLLGVEDDWFLLRLYELEQLGQEMRAPQAWLRDLPFHGRLDALEAVIDKLAFTRVTA